MKQVGVVLLHILDAIIVQNGVTPALTSSSGPIYACGLRGSSETIVFSPKLASQQVLPYEELCLYSGHNDDEEDYPLAASSMFFAPIPLHTRPEYGKSSSHGSAFCAGMVLFW